MVLDEQTLAHLKADIVMGKPLDSAKVAALILAYDTLRNRDRPKPTLRLVARVVETEK